MDSNQRHFVEDALDLLNELDEGLMQLESNPQASAPLEQIFRTLHTIKGGANMFGFSNIGELAHNLETVFDLVRAGKVAINDEIISLTLQSFDRVRDLLKENNAEAIADRTTLQSHIQAALDLVKTLESHVEDPGFQKTIDASEQVATYYVSITPKVTITEDGNHPLVFIIQDLLALGTSRCFIRKHADLSIIKWDLFLYTSIPQDELGSYFLFVEDECTCEFIRLSTHNLFEGEDFKNRVNELETSGDRIPEILEHFRNESLRNFQGKDDLPEHKAQKTGKSRSEQVNYIKVNKRKVDDLLNWISELIILQAQFANLITATQDSRFADANEQLELVINHLRDTSLEIGLVPVETLVTKFKRLVRDLSKSLEKKVNFISEGAETEMDKDLIEMITDPMIHVIRNAIDHGIESPSQRKSAGKPEYGTIKLKAFNTNSYVNLVITDDGKGINRKSVHEKALSKGIISPEETLTDEEILSLVFHPGLSTAEKVSDVSGRGVGMDVVRQKINELRGYVTIESVEGKGTTLHIKLPLSRSIIEGLLVRVDETRYILPLNVIERIDRVPYETLIKDKCANPLILVNESPIPVFKLRREFHSEMNPPKTADIVSITVNGCKKGIAVDRIEGKMQTVMKPLGEAYQNQDFISGSSILGDGSLALVLDPQRLFHHYSN